MKKSIEWHKECLKNAKAQVNRLRLEAESLMKNVEDKERSNALAQAQIDLAIREGKDSFDREKYAIKRLCV